MCKTNDKFKKSIELFHEKTGDVVRVLRFKNLKDFNDFLYAFRSMRYPGYSWKFKDNGEKGRYHEAEN